MRGLVTKIIPLLVTAALVIALSLYFDAGSCSLAWFQRSGSLVALIGALLGYRSILRLGRAGVGGVAVNPIMVKVISVDNSGPRPMLKYSIDESTRKYLREADYDKLAGFIGVFLIIFGTLIWGYGDLLGCLVR